MGCYTSSIENGVQNPKINWKENSRVRIGRIAFTAEAAKQCLKAVRMKDGELSNTRAIRRHSGEDDYSTKTEELSGKFLTRVQFIHTVDRARDDYFLAEAELLSGEKARKEGEHTLVQKEDKHFLLNFRDLFQQRCQRSRSSYR